MASPFFKSLLSTQKQITNISYRHISFLLYHFVQPTRKLLTFVKFVQDKSNGTMTLLKKGITE